MAKRPEAGTIAFQKFIREDGHVGVRVVSANNEVLLSSEGYADVRDADNLIAIIQEKAPEAAVFDLR